MDAIDLGERIKSARIHRGLTQQHIASLLGVSAQAVSKWERGENAPDLFTMPPLAAVLNTSVDLLLGNENRVVRSVDGTIFFAAIAGYTAASERTASSDIALMLNSHFYLLTECVLQNDGIPIKYLGDGFLAVFIAGEHSFHALHSAITAKTLCNQPISIGIASGSFYMGRIGHPDFARVDVVGDFVNLAARVQGWAGNNTNSGIAATAEAVGTCFEKVNIGEAKSVEIKGKTGPSLLHEVIAISE